jgi:hypothetical protein
MLRKKQACRNRMEVSATVTEIPEAGEGEKENSRLSPLKIHVGNAWEKETAYLCGQSHAEPHGCSPPAQTKSNQSVGMAFGDTVGIVIAVDGCEQDDEADVIALQHGSLRLNSFQNMGANLPRAARRRRLSYKAISKLWSS